MWEDMILLTAIGFAAQVVDGALGMAYGATAATMLLSLGIAPAVASASVHAAEVLTSGASGLAHWRLGNVDPALLRRLVLGGVLGGVIGVFVVTAAPASIIRPFVSAYLFVMGSLIVWRAVRPRAEMGGAACLEARPRYVSSLGCVGGFLDAIGGGGWGAMVTSTLIGHGIAPRLAIGSANSAEFFVTAMVTVTFVTTIGLELWPVIVSLVLGGVLAAPFAALITRRLPDRPLMLLVGVVIILLSLRGLVLVLEGR
jgi:uncharacterized protein